MQGFWGARQAENQQESTAEASTQQSSTPLLNGLGSGVVFMIVTNGPGQRVQQRLVVDRFAKESRGPGSFGRRPRFFGILC